MDEETASYARGFWGLDAVAILALALAQVLWLTGSAILFLSAGAAGDAIATVMTITSLVVLFLMWELWGDLLRARWRKRK